MRARKFFTIMILLAFFTAFSLALTDAPKLQEKTKELTINSWLLLGPFSSPLPAFHKSGKKGFSIEELLKYNEIDITKLKPAPESSFQWRDGQPVKWQEFLAEENVITLPSDKRLP